jgi:hypothetical protein
LGYDRFVAVTGKDLRLYNIKIVIGFSGELLVPPQDRAARLGLLLRKVGYVPGFPSLCACTQAGKERLKLSSAIGKAIGCARHKADFLGEMRG